MIPGKPSSREEGASEPIADLPLFSDEEIAGIEGGSRRRASSSRPGTEDDRKVGAEEARAEPEPSAEAAGAQALLPVGPAADEPSPEPGEPYPAPLRMRLRAATLDLAAGGAVLIILLTGGLLLGAPTDLSALPFYLPTWLLVSCLYHVVPLLFWGRTPGMAYVGLVARNEDGRPLDIGQALRRWLGATLSLLGLGVPALLSLTGRSLSDRLSRSTTLAS